MLSYNNLLPLEYRAFIVFGFDVSAEGEKKAGTYREKTGKNRHAYRY